MTGSPPPPPPPPIAVVLGPDRVSSAAHDALRDGALVAPAELAVFDLLGPGAVTCFQGLLTNDIEQPGDGAFVYGALLTPKGMIVTDGWGSRLGARVTFAVAPAAGERVADVYRRSIPPRLARWSERGASVAAVRLAGPRALAVAERAGIAPPGAGRSADVVAHGIACETAVFPENAPYAAQILCAPADRDALLERLADAGARIEAPAALELARVLAGWPALDAEIDDRTIPQEVRFDDIGGVSYTKGCYTGQETVSRLHFRGHTNRELRGLLFAATPHPADGAIRGSDRDLGRVTSVAWLPAGRWVGLGVVRREVEPGVEVRAAGARATVVDLPFVLPHIMPA